MNSTIASIKTNLESVIKEQQTTQFAVASFGDVAFPNPFTVIQALTNNVAALVAAVDSLTAEGGGDIPEEISTGAITFRAYGIL
jgi:hypothetical protein